MCVCVIFVIQLVFMVRCSQRLMHKCQLVLTLPCGDCCQVADHSLSRLPGIHLFFLLPPMHSSDPRPTTRHRCKSHQLTSHQLCFMLPLEQMGVHGFTDFSSNFTLSMHPTASGGLISDFSLILHILCLDLIFPAPPAIM